MTKIMIVLLLACAACNNSSDASKDNSSDSTGGTTVSSWTKDDENEFLFDCIDNAKARYSEDTAYTYCNCVLKKVKQRFPSPDSADAVLIDSASVAELTKECY